MHRDTDQRSDHGVDIAKRRGFDDQAQQKDHCQYAKSRNQRQEGFRHRWRHPFRHIDHQIAVMHEPVDFRRQQRHHDCHKQSLAADKVHRQHAFDNLLRGTFHRGKKGVLRYGHDKRH
ncbi:hypothetical protein D3C71_1345550 [compost metagenome]